ncbi:hypothetical protein TRIUR3_30516 [Triticum urartu]|uniref:DUF642 domain-containing protein n=1 Tax=Triticum urartu TaxID=4572 RepID=M7YKF5_TRIUA|nr:hypothetical protein TRIUR3_30516 [Triticum urartu]
MERGLVALLGLGLALLLLAPSRRLASAAPVEDVLLIRQVFVRLKMTDNPQPQVAMCMGPHVHGTTTILLCSIGRVWWMSPSPSPHKMAGRGHSHGSWLAVLVRTVTPNQGGLSSSTASHELPGVYNGKKLGRASVFSTVKSWRKRSQFPQKKWSVKQDYPVSFKGKIFRQEVTPKYQLLEVQIKGLLMNGDFETAPPGGFVKSASVSEGAAIPSWTINGTVELISAGQHQGGMILIVPQGDHAVRLGNDAGIGQVVEVEKGSEYAITFSAARTCAQLESLNISAGSVSQTVDLQTLYSIEGWDAYALAFQAVDEQASIEFRNPGMEDDPTCGPILDNVAIKKLFSPDKAKENMVINGDFEEGPWMFANTSFGVLLPTNLDEQTSALPGWMIESNRAVRFVDSDQYTVPQGKRAIELLSGKEGIISQMVQTTPQKAYTLTFTLGSAGDSCQPPMAVMAFAGDQAQNFHYSPMGNAPSQAVNVNFTARAERTRVALYSVYYNTRSDDHSSLCGPVIDDVRVWGLNGAAGLKASIRMLIAMASVIVLVLF